MTLDTFKLVMNSIAVKFKVDVTELMEKGVKAGLDLDIMYNIMQVEMEKLQND